MTYWLKTVAGILVLTLTAGSVNAVEAADYGNPANDTQVQMRSQSQQMQSMSSEERTLYRDLNEPASRGKGKGNAGGNKQRYGQGNSNGSGSMHRYGQGGEQAYGSGYGSRQGGGGNGGGRGR